MEFVKNGTNGTCVKKIRARKRKYLQRRGVLFPNSMIFANKWYDNCKQTVFTCAPVFLRKILSFLDKYHFLDKYIFFGQIFADKWCLYARQWHHLSFRPTCDRHASIHANSPDHCQRWEGEFHIKYKRPYEYKRASKLYLYFFLA